MDREAIARRRRRHEALEALEFERDREAALRDQVEEIVLEQEREHVDRAALALLEATDAGLVREILGGGEDEGDDEGDDASAEWDDVFAGVEDELDDDADGDEQDEVERLLLEIEESRARQRALERFVDALELA